MVYQNKINEFNKQEILTQIEDELLTKSQPTHEIRQKTKSNFRFVVVLDLIALLLAVAGVFIVYTVFREQQIRLVSGQQGVKVLESTLLEEINKQHARDLALKEQELEEVRSRLRDLENNYADELRRINRDAEARLQAERATLEEEITGQLIGKSEAEQAEIRRQYEERIRSLERNVEQESVGVFLYLGFWMNRLNYPKCAIFL